MVNKAPIWPRPTSTRLNQRAEEFKANLKAVAESLANHDQVDSVSTRHVDQSFSALARVGLTCRKFYRRAEFETACGGILIGAAFASHDCVELCVGELRPIHYGYIAGIAIPMFVIGFFLWIHSVLVQRETEFQ
jgi:hypothetical protein